MEDKRKVERKHLVDYLRVFDRGSNKLLGYLIDITEKGLMVVTRSKLEKNSIFQLKVLLGEEEEEKENNKQIHLDVKTKWCRKSRISGFNEVGFEMLLVTEEAFNLLKTKLL